MTNADATAPPPADEGTSKAPTREKGKRTRERLLRAAVTVFERDGYSAARVADITSEAGVAHGSFYTYFDSKDDVFREAAGAVVDEINEALDSAVSASPQARSIVRAGNQMFLDMYARHAAMLGQIGQLATTDDYFREMRLDLRRRLTRHVEGAIRHMAALGDAHVEGVDRHILATALAGMADSFAYAMFVLKDPVSPDAIETLDEIWLRALGVR